MQKLNLSDNIETNQNNPYTDDGRDFKRRIDEKQYLGQNQSSNNDRDQLFSAHSREESLDLNSKKSDMTKKSKKMLATISILVVFLGVMTGFGAYQLNAKSGTGGKSSTANIQQVAEGTVKAGDVFGIQDQDIFKDSAQGYLEEGGINGEGSHKLLREGGATQTVVLTSSVTDLSKFEGMEVKIMGETFKAQKAGWLMDVGRVEIVEVNGTIPSEK